MSSCKAAEPASLPKGQAGNVGGLSLWDLPGGAELGDRPPVGLGGWAGRGPGPQRDPQSS